MPIGFASGGEPSAADLRLWLADLEALHDQLEQLETHHGMLAADEQAWPAAGRPEARRHRRLARIVLRLLLAQAGVPGARGRPLPIDAHGKPHLGPGEPAFNISHSGGFALVALAPRGPIGVDLETERVVQLGPARQALIVAAGVAMGGQALVGDIRDATAPGTAPFLRAWTVLEAVAKARGSGVGRLLTELGITATGVRQNSAEHVAVQARAIIAETALAVAPLELPAGHHGAVCAPIEIVTHGANVVQLSAPMCHLRDV